MRSVELAAGVYYVSVDGLLGNLADDMQARIDNAITVADALGGINYLNINPPDGQDLAAAAVTELPGNRARRARHAARVRRQQLRHGRRPGAPRDL